MNMNFAITEKLIDNTDKTCDRGQLPPPPLRTIAAMNNPGKFSTHVAENSVSHVISGLGLPFCVLK